MKSVKRSTFFVVLVLVSCERIEYYPDRPLIFEGTYIIAHQGGGTFDAGNTFEACKFGLERADGIEVDIQKDANDRLWLSHEAVLPACGDLDGTCFAALNTNTVVELDTCLGNSINYTPLETVFAYMSIHYPEKFISVDVKPWSPCEVASLNIIRQMNRMGQEIIDLSRKYNMEHRVVVESEVGDFLYYVKTHSDKIETYLVTLGDFELGMSRALDAGFSGVSFQYNIAEPVTKELVELMHRKGLKIQLWTIEVAADMDGARALNPDFIQTDVL